jgi:formate/nitrite transporter FocA (FNT family)
MISRVPPAIKESDAASDTDDDDPQSREAEERRSPSGKVVYAAIMKEADEELERPSSALFWSGLAAGLAMGFSFIAEAVLRHHLPDTRWAPLVVKLGYSVGFVIVILGRQQLFTENTLTPILPLLQRKDRETLVNVLRLWAIVFVANMLGALVIGWVTTRTPAFDYDVRREFVALGHEAMGHPFGVVVLRAIFAGWLIAILVWMLPYAESTHFFVIIMITWVIGVGHFPHVVAGAVEVFALAWAGEKPWGSVLGAFLLPTLIGNVIGGITIVAALNHAQVVAGQGGTADGGK